MGPPLDYFPPNFINPPPPSPMLNSPLLQNPMMQSAFLLNHLLLPTLYSAVTPQAFKNSTLNEQFQFYFSKNREIINTINQNVTDIIKKSYRKDGRVYEEDNEERCRRKRNLAYSVTSVQGTMLELQEAVAKSYLKKQLGSEIKGLVKSMLSDLEMQKKRLDKIKSNQAHADEEEARARRTTTRCKEPFLPVGQECFYVGFREKLGWHQARSACHKLQAHLAEPENPRALARALRKDWKKVPNRSWIGGSDVEQEGDWKWLSGGSLIGSRDWRQGQPSNYSRQGHNVQDCLVLIKKSTKEAPLDDFSCWIPRAYICEIQPEC